MAFQAAALHERSAAHLLYPQFRRQNVYSDEMDQVLPDSPLAEASLTGSGRFVGQASPRAKQALKRAIPPLQTRIIEPRCAPTNTPTSSSSRTASGGIEGSTTSSSATSIRKRPEDPLASSTPAAEPGSS